VDQIDPLTRDEDDELRRLHWFSELAPLADTKRRRFAELRSRDRRNEVRSPRELGPDPKTENDETAGR
jgi:hypothetical protein